MGRVVTRSPKCNDNSNSNSNSSKRCKVISKVLLPQDLMHHILTLLPLKCLVNSARYVCKPWATIIQTSEFAQAYLRHSKPGLFVQGSKHTYFLDIIDCVNGQFEFEKTDMGTQFGNVTIIDICNGIFVLLEQNKSLAQIVAFLVNPITKSCFRTPPLPRSQKPQKRFELFYSAIDFSVCSPYSQIQDLLHRRPRDNSWREIGRKKAALSWRKFGKKTLYDGGNYLYWITPEHGITFVDVDKEIIVGKFSLPPVPMDCAVGDVEMLFSTFLWMGNQLSCFVVKGIIFETFQIYLLDLDSGKWSLYHDVGHLDYVAACGHELTIFHVFFTCWIHDKIIFDIIFKEKRPQAIVSNMNFSYSVKTRKLTKIEGISIGEQVMLHTNNLISLPSTPTKFPCNFGPSENHAFQMNHVKSFVGSCVRSTVIRALSPKPCRLFRKQNQYQPLMALDICFPCGRVASIFDLSSSSASLFSSGERRS